MIEHEDEDDIFVAPYIDAGVDGNGSEVQHNRANLWT
jgi:hypothetical protein